MLTSRVRRHSGFALMEAMIAIVIVGIISLWMARMFTQQTENLNVERQARWMSQYLNAIAGYMAQQGPVAPATLVQTGTDWLKPNTCGGTFPAADAYLPCSIPTDFNTRFGLGQPTVTFDYTTSPVAAVNFGIVVQSPSGNPDPRVASRLSLFMNEHVASAGFQHISVFHALPDNSDVTSANLRARIDSQAVVSPYLRTDGQNEMTAPLLTEHDEWALIGRDSSGTENVAAKSRVASLNANDAFFRASGDGAGFWVSETHEIAEQALRIASRSISGASEVGSGDTVSKPDCPLGMLPQLFVGNVNFLAGTELNPKLVSGIKKETADTGSAWRIQLLAIYEGVDDWQVIPNEYGRALALTRCVN